MHRSKKITVLFTTYLLAGILILVGFILQSQREEENLRRQLRADYQRAFSTLVINVTEMDSALQKGLYATSPSLVSAVCTEVFGKAMAAQAALGELPFSEYQLEQTAGFISRVGDYAFLLSRSAASGQKTETEYTDNLRALSDAASLLADNLTQLQADLNAGLLTLEEIDAADAQVASIGETFQLIESEFPEIPTLIYDGPFSHHLTQQTALALESLETVSQSQALESAAEWTGIKAGAFEFAGESGGALPCYYFLAAADGGELSVCVTKQGGKVVSMFSSRDVSHQNLSSEAMLEIASAYLLEKGFDSMKESYWTIENNIGIINFAYTQDDVVCYPDLIKVHVELDSGRVVGFEALGYIMSHTARELPQPEITVEDAMRAVPDSLEILSQGLAIIPSAGKYELFCYEFICENQDGRHYILYVNAQSGQQEKILILLESENGTLTL